jgi:hypothetical protein
MKARNALRRGSVIVPAGPSRRRRRITLRDEVLGPAALEAPLPGTLLVLLSRLHRSEAGHARKDEEPAA